MSDEQVPSKSQFLDWLRRSFDACPECGAEVQVWERVCFGWDPHNTYLCFGCGWRGRKPVHGMRPACSTCGDRGLVPNGLPSNGPEPCPDCHSAAPGVSPYGREQQ